MQFLKPLPLPVETVQEDPEERLQRWRHAYQVYQIRLAIFYSEQTQLKEQVDQYREYQRQLAFQREDLERHKREIIQRQFLYGKRSISFS